jgi:hypothetical protein
MLPHDHPPTACRPVPGRAPFHLSLQKEHEACLVKEMQHTSRTACIASLQRFQ